MKMHLDNQPNSSGACRTLGRVACMIACPMQPTFKSLSFPTNNIFSRSVSNSERYSVAVSVFDISKLDGYMPLSCTTDFMSLLISCATVLISRIFSAWVSVSFSVGKSHGALWMLHLKNMTTFS